LLTRLLLFLRRYWRHRLRASGRFRAGCNAGAIRRRNVAKVEDLDPTSSRAVAEYLSVLDDAAFGGATLVEPKTISPTDPAARYTAAADRPAVYAYSDNYLIDLKHAVIMDVGATTAIRQAEVGAAKTMLDRAAEQFDMTPSRLVADAGYGSAERVGWLVDERGIKPHVKLMDKSERTDGALSRSDFAFDPAGNRYVCPGGKELRNIIARSRQTRGDILSAARARYVGDRSIRPGSRGAFFASLRANSKALRTKEKNTPIGA
jgi:Transposase DDE domain